MRRLGLLMLVTVALLYFSQAIGQLFSLAYSLRTASITTEGLKAQVGFSLAAVGLMIGMGVVLLLFREPIARALFRADDGDVAITLDTRSLLFVGIVFIGLNLMLSGLLNAVMGFTNAWGERAATSALGDPESGIALMTVSAAVGHSVRFLVGLGLVWGARPISVFLTTTRVPKPVFEAPSAPRCPECGTPYNLSDYRPGAEARCIECHAPLPPRGA